MRHILLNQSLEKLEMTSENAKKPSVGEDWIIAVYMNKQVLIDLVTDCYKQTKCNPVSRNKTSLLSAHGLHTLN